MWKNQIFYTPFDFGQYVNDTLEIYTIRDMESLVNANRSQVTFAYRSSHNSSRGVPFMDTDTWMYSRYKVSLISFALRVAFVSCVTMRPGPSRGFEADGVPAEYGCFRRVCRVCVSLRSFREKRREPLFGTLEEKTHVEQHRAGRDLAFDHARRDGWRRDTHCGWPVDGCGEGRCRGRRLTLCS